MVHKQLLKLCFQDAPCLCKLGIMETILNGIDHQLQPNSCMMCAQPKCSLRWKE